MATHKPNKKREYFNHIQQLFSTEERIKILDHLLSQDIDRIKVSELSRKLMVNKGLVSKYSNLLSRLGIISNDGNTYKIEYNNPFTKSIKIMLNINKMSMIKLNPYIKSLGIYGSFSKGLNKKNSDLDVWIITKDIKEEEIAKLERELGEAIGTEAHILLLTEDKLKRLKKEDPLFYYSLVFGSFMLKGEAIEG